MCAGQQLADADIHEMCLISPAPLIQINPVIRAPDMTQPCLNVGPASETLAQHSDEVDCSEWRFRIHLPGCCHNQQISD